MSFLKADSSSSNLNRIALSFIFVVFFLRCSLAADFSRPVCAKDLNGNGFIESSEYANCKLNYSCPLDPSIPCDTATHMCVMEENPDCPAGSELNKEKDICEADPQVECPEDYSWDEVIDFCVAQPYCPSGAVFSEKRKRCEKSVVKECPSGFWLSGDECRRLPYCPGGGTFVAARGRCEKYPSYSCPSGWWRVEDHCESNPYCPSGSYYSLSTGLCVRPPEISKSCPPGYYLSGSKCIRDPVCPSGGWWNSSKKRCEASKQSTTKWRCSLNGQEYSSWYACYVSCRGGTSECRYSPTDMVDTDPYCGWCLCKYGGKKYSFYWDGSYLGSSDSSLTVGDCTYYLGSLKVDAGPGSCTGCPPCRIREYEICRTCTTQGSCDSVTSYSCPSGYYWDGSACVSYSYYCPSGGSFSWWLGKCYTSYEEEVSCPAGFWYYSSIKKCAKNATCSMGYLDKSKGKCVINASPDCPSGYAYDSWREVCYRSADCSPGVYRDGYCVAEVRNDCGSFSYDAKLDLCYSDPLCPGSGSFAREVGVCLIETIHNCPEGMAYEKAERKCTAPVSCKEGEYDPEKDKCELSAKCDSKWDCPYGEAPCIAVITKDTPDAANQFETHEGDKGFYDDDGEVTEEGCNGQVYVFNGYPMECLTAGIQTGFHNCCSGECDGRIDNYIDQETESYGTLISNTMAYKAIKAAIYAYQAYKAYEAAKVVNEHVIKYFKKSSAIAGAPANAAEQWAEEWGAKMRGENIPNPKTAVDDILTMNGVKNMLLSAGKAYLYSMALDFATDLAFKAFFGGCTAQDNLTVCYKNHGLCHYVGSYCKEEWPLVGCVQRAKVYCCFNSKLARIVHEQGRPQLKQFSKEGWGDPEDSPNCRGFTPQEFQMLDFSRIDLSEWYADLKTKAQSEIQESLQKNVEEFKEKLK